MATLQEACWKFITWVPHKFSFVIALTDKKVYTTEKQKGQLVLLKIMLSNI